MTEPLYVVNIYLPKREYTITQEELDAIKTLSYLGRYEPQTYGAETTKRLREWDIAEGRVHNLLVRLNVK